MDGQDSTVGINVRKLREARGLSQAELASEMTKRGLPGFHPQTITKIEKGVRSVKLVEGVPLADILGAEAGDLLKTSEAAVSSAAFQRLIGEHVQEIEHICWQIALNRDLLVVEQEKLRWVLEDSEVISAPEGLVAAARESLEVTPQSALAAGNPLRPKSRNAESGATAAELGLLVGGMAVKPQPDARDRHGKGVSVDTKHGRALSTVKDMIDHGKHPEA